MKNVIITILVILVLGLGGYLVYDKVIEKDNNEVTENNQNKEEGKDIIENNTSNVVEKVVPYVNEENGVPYVTLENFETVNQKIKIFYNSSVSTYKYDYSVKNNILFIYLNKATQVGMGGNVEAEGIYIDLDNNKELSIYNKKFIIGN